MDTHTHIQVFIRLRRSRTPHLATKLNLATSHNLATLRSCTNLTSQLHECKRIQTHTHRDTDRQREKGRKAISAMKRDMTTTHEHTGSCLMVIKDSKKHSHSVSMWPDNVNTASKACYMKH